jgi:radical SAM superfamily enzyme YgiQ (UPF0313 family)
MKIAFILNSLNVSTPLGIMHLSAALKREGHETFLICFKKENLFKKLKELKPDILAYSITTGAHKEYISINKKIKKYFKGYSIFGGPHPTFYPEIIKEEGIDAVCRGEGEEALVELVNKLEKGKDISKIKNFWIKQNGKIIKNPVRLLSDLDDLPFPDREIIYEKDEFFLKLGMKRIITSRGCPFKCTYCFNRQYNKLYEGKGRIVRHRSVDNVLNEIRDIKKKYPLTVIKFIDDTFNLNKQWLKEFTSKYKKEIGLPFICNLRADLVDLEVVKQLKKANCKVVYLGIETGNETVRKKILERNMSNEQILNACKILKRYKIKIVAQNMLGLPGETISGTFETILFNSKCKVDFSGFSIFQPYPDTLLSNYAIKNGFFDGNFDKLSSNYLSTTSLNYSQNEKKQLENLLKLATMTSLYPFLTPLVKKLIKFPKNKFFDIIYSFFYGVSQWKLYSMVIKSPTELIPISKKLFGFLFKT